ncbi:hypothetical protein ACWKSP_35920 [Micromonosporaceae bacterium Da 78-11]
MTRISVTLDDPVADAVKAAAGGDGKVSKWIARLVQEKLLADACAAAAQLDRDQTDDEWETARLEGRA